MSTENEEWREDSKSENTDAGRDGNRSFNREGGYSRPSYNREGGDRPYRPRFNSNSEDRPQRSYGDRPQRPSYNREGGDRPYRPRFNSEGGDRPQRSMATVRNVLHTIVKAVTVPIVRDTITITDRRDSHVRYVVRGITIRMLNTVRKNRLNTKNNLLIRMNRSV